MTPTTCPRCTWLYQMALSRLRTNANVPAGPLQIAGSDVAYPLIHCQEFPPAPRT